MYVESCIAHTFHGNWIVQNGAETLLPSSLRMHICTGRHWPEVAELISCLCLMRVQAALLTGCTACNLVGVVRRSLKHAFKLVCVLTCTSSAFDLQVEGCWPPFLRIKQTCAFRLYRKQATPKQPPLDKSLRALATLLCSISRMTCLYTTASCAYYTKTVVI